MQSLTKLFAVLLLGTGMGACCLAQAAARQSASSTADQAQPTAAADPLTGATIAPPAHPITAAQTKEMFELMHFRSTMQAMLHTNLEEQRKRAPTIPDDVWQDFEASFAKADFETLFLPIYQKYLSEEDAAQALAFYRTPAGQHTLSVMPALMQEIAQASQKEGEKIAEDVFQRHHQEIEDAVKKLSPPAATPGAPPADDPGK